MAKTPSPVSNKDAKKIKPGTVIAFAKGSDTLRGAVIHNDKGSEEMNVLVETAPGKFKVKLVKYKKLTAIGPVLTLPSQQDATRV